MARTSNITFGQVAQIADAMKAAGTRPTARAVRERIGSGSMGTIHKLLQQWTGKGNTQDEEEIEAAELPAHIQSALMDFIGTEIATACEPLNEELQAAKEAAEHIAEENERLERVIARQEDELSGAWKKQNECAALLSKAETTLEDANRERYELQTVRSELLRDLDRSQRQVEMLASYATDLDAARRALAESEAKRIEAERNAAVLTAQLTAKTEKADELQARLIQGEKTHNTLLAEFKQENIRYQACAARLEAAAREIESLRKPKPSPTPKATKPKAAKTINANS